jgi:hypothetical protein
LVITFFLDVFNVLCGAFYTSPAIVVRNHHTFREAQSNATGLQSLHTTETGTETGQEHCKELDVVAPKEEIEYIIEEGEEEEAKEDDPEIRS